MLALVNWSVTGIARVPGQVCVHVVCVRVKTSPER